MSQKSHSLVTHFNLLNDRIGKVFNLIELRPTHKKSINNLMSWYYHHITILSLISPEIRISHKVSMFAQHLTTHEYPVKLAVLRFLSKVTI